MPKIIVHCQGAGPRSQKPGSKLNSAQFGPETTTDVAKASNASNFKESTPGIQIALANLTDPAVAEFEVGAVYEVTFTKVG